MTNSSLVTYKNLSNKHSGPRTNRIQAVVIHHMCAKWTGRRCVDYFADETKRQVSVQYGIGWQGDIAQNVLEENRAWTSSSAWADNRAVTIEVSDLGIKYPWASSKEAMVALIKLVTDIHRRNGISECTYTGNTNGTLWKHKWFASTDCPGNYLEANFHYIAQEVNKLLKPQAATAKPQPLQSNQSTFITAQPIKAYANAEDAMAGRNPKATYPAGTYYVFKAYANGSLNISKNKNAPGGWVNPKDKVRVVIATPTADVLNKEYIKIAYQILSKNNPYGNGEVRKQRLGAKYGPVQEIINRILKGESFQLIKNLVTSATKSNGAKATIGENCLTTAPLNARYAPVLRAGLRFTLPQGHQVKVLADAGTSDKFQWVKVQYQGPKNYNGRDYSKATYVDYVAAKYLR